MARTRQPNILFITGDQHRGDCLGVAGGQVKTPHLDDLADFGTRFDLCICPNPVCQPSRASILTGLMPFTHGVHDNGIDLDPAFGQTGFSAQLARAGYKTGLIGKAHFSSYFTFEPTGTVECVRSSANVPADWNGPYFGFDEVQLVLIGHNIWPPAKPPSGHHYERWYHRDGRGDERTALYFSKARPDSGAAQTWHSKLPVAWHNSTWIANQTIEYIRRHADEPFCLWASFPDPHAPFDAPEPWSYLHQPSEIRLPKNHVRDFDKRPWWHRAILEGEPTGTAETIAIRKNIAKMVPQSDQQLREIMANYFGMISLIDHNIGRMLIALQEMGIADNTYVVYTADHGEWLGDHGLILKGPMPYDGLLRIPLIVRGPGVARNQVVSEPVSTLDVAPTFFEWAGIKAEVPLDGRSLGPLLAGQEEQRDCALDEWWVLPARGGVELQLLTVRTKRFRMTVDLLSGAGELYDFENDPDEMVNVFDDPAYQSHRNQLRRYLEPRIAAMPSQASVQVGTG